MLRSFVLLLVICFSFSLSAQTPSRTWVMAFVKAKQPVFTMFEEEGSYELADEVPQDSLYLFSPGLMSIHFDAEGIRSYSWEGEETWTSQVTEDSLYLFGQRDTLYGVFNEQKIILSSTLDDRPTEYHFDPLAEKGAESPNLLGFSWEVRAKGHPFDKATIRFSLQPNSTRFNFKPLDLGSMKAFEFELPPSTPGGSDQEYGIVYLFQKRRNRIDGVFYPARNDSGAPTRKTIRLVKK